jgi:hypothetical protein
MQRKQPQCDLCDTLSLVGIGHETNTEATAAELERSAVSCSLCTLLLEVVQSYVPDPRARKRGILKWEGVPLDAGDRGATAEGTKLTDFRWFPKRGSRVPNQFFLHSFTLPGKHILLW